MPNLNAVPAKGDIFTFNKVLMPHILYQNRPWACRPSCSCGNCNGKYERLPLPVDEVIFWADNSVEIAATFDGVRYTCLVIPPHGDAC